MKLSCPGKTFLLGEYLAIEGGPSILASTGPRFEMSVLEGQADCPFHFESPAGRLFAQNGSQFENLKIEFLDPQHGLGGLGASTAQFVLLYAYLKNWQARDSWTAATHLNADGVLMRARSGGPTATTPLDWKTILSDYRACAWKGQGFPPSGADLVSQICGQVTIYDGREFTAREYVWPFEQLEFTLLRTGVKVATHEHLHSQTEPLPIEKLRILVGHANEAFKEALVLGDRHAAESFSTAVNSYHEVLLQSGLVYENTRHLVEALKQIPGVRAAKGCGALGADIVLVCHNAEARLAIEAWLPTGVSIAGTDRDLTHGLEIQARKKRK